MKRFVSCFLLCTMIFLPIWAMAADNWGLSFPNPGEKPIGNATAESLLELDAYFVDSGDEKVIYLTFDAGYENGYTAPILDVLEKTETPAAFFLVGNYIRDNSELIQRMVDEGHIVANHTMRHPDMSQISSLEKFSAELREAEALYESIIGAPMPKLYRPPKGKYSQENLKMAKDLGYTTLFWSLAYVDWYDDDQPSHEEAFSKLIPRVHPGAIILLHNTSRTNMEILEELIVRYKEAGYRFESVNRFLEKDR